MEQLLESILQSHEVIEENLQTVINQKMNDLSKEIDSKLNEVTLQLRKTPDQNHNISHKPLQEILVNDDDIKCIKTDIVLIKEELTITLLEKDDDLKEIKDNANTVINKLKDKIKKLEEDLEKKHNSVNVDEYFMDDLDNATTDTTLEEKLRNEIKILNSRIFLMQENAKSNCLRLNGDIQAKNESILIKDAKIEEMKGCLAELQVESLEQDDDCSDLIQIEKEIDDMKRIHRKNIEDLKNDYENKISVLRKENEATINSLKTSCNDKLETKDKEIKAVSKELDEQKKKNVGLEEKVKRREMYMKQLEAEVKFWKNYEKYLRNSLKDRDASLERARKRLSTEENGIGGISKQEDEKQRSRSQRRVRRGRSVSTKIKDSNSAVLREHNNSARREGSYKICNNGRTNGTNNESNNGTNNESNNGRTNGTNNGRSNGTNNGRTNGTDNGRSNESNNGTNNGRTNGTNNGRTNGTNNGRTNGTNNGRANGTDSCRSNEGNNSTNNGRNKSCSRNSMNKTNKINRDASDRNNNNDVTKTAIKAESSKVQKESYSRGLKSLNVIRNGKQDNKSSGSNSVVGGDTTNSVSSASDSGASGSNPDPADSHVRIQFQGPGPQEVHFRIKRMDEIFWVLVSHSSKVGIPASALIYKYKSITLKGIETPDSLGMLSGDSVHNVQVYRSNT